MSEVKVRNAAKKLGWRVIKSRTKNTHLNDQGRYQLIDDRNCVVAGASYDASLSEIAVCIEAGR